MINESRYTLFYMLDKWLFEGLKVTLSKGVYPQSNGRVAIAHIDVLKGFIDLWVHFFVAIEDNYFDGKVFFFGFD